MTYLIVFLVIVIRVFGFKKTMRITSEIASAVARQFGSPASKMAPALRQMPSANNFQDDKSARNSGAKKSEKTAIWGEIRKNPELVSANSMANKKSRGNVPPHIHASGRTSEEILAGKPDFGWRRIK